MKRWAAPFLLTLLAALPIFFLQRDPGEPGRVLEWATRFGVFWDLEPSTLACLLGIGLLFWFLRELTDRPGLTLGGAGLFALSQWSALHPLLPFWYGAAGLTFVVGVVRHRLHVLRYAAASLALCGVGYEAAAQDALHGQAVLYPTGATLICAWTLVPLALYARFERLRGRAEVPITPETPPATRTTRAAAAAAAPTLWIEFAVAATALATFLADRGYLVPPMLVVVGLTMWGDGYRPAWRWHIAFTLLFAAKVGYSAWRGDLFTAMVRFDPATFAVLFPPLVFGQATLGVVYSGPLSTLSNPVLFRGTTPFRFISGLTAYVEGRRLGALALGGLTLATFALLPGLFKGVTRFDLYGALLFRNLFVAALGMAALRSAASAWCPPSRPAPPRPRPAPGSLPRP